MDHGACSYRRFLDGEESAFDEIMKELFHGLVFFVDRYVHEKWDEEMLSVGDMRGGRYQELDFFGGNLNGVIEKLPYLKSLGVDIIYLNPLPLFKPDGSVL